MASSRSTRRGSQYLAAEQELSIGFCPEHGRANEAYCEECRIVICPSCLMFGSHQGHKVLSPGQAARLIRDKIDKTNKAGKLGPDYAERYLQEIRDSKSRLVRSQNAVMAQIQENFNKLIQHLKSRREDILNEITEHFRKENEVVEKSENMWEDKQLLSKKIVELATNQSSESLLVNSFLVLSGADSLDLPVRYQKLRLLTCIDFSVEIDGKIVSFLQFLEGLSQLGNFSDMKNLQFRS